MVATKRGLCILAIALATVAAGCGSRETSRRGADPSTVEAAIASCKQRIEASALSATLKDELKKSCSQDASGDGMVSPAQKTRREVCRKIVLQRTPPGPARERGLAACALNTRNP
jgi:hypothetical protein